MSFRKKWSSAPVAPVQLDDTQRELRDTVQQKLNNVLERIRNFDAVDPEDLATMAEAAHELHLSLRRSGVTPKHHEYMLKNRGCSPDTIDFYRHVHPVEDLLAFVADATVNDDPQDQTIDHEFAFTVYSRRWRHTDTYRLKRTRAGWVVQSPQVIPVGRDGRVGRQDGTGLFHLLDHDSINYPEALPGYLEWLWDRSEAEGLSHDQVQGALNQLAEWVRTCEQSSPTGIFEDYK